MSYKDQDTPRLAQLHIIFLQQVFTEHQKLDMIVKQCTVCARYCNAAQNHTILSDLVQHIPANAGNM
jgi:hypothetical protein